MVSEYYAKAYKEIIEILKYTKKSDVRKIPKEKIIMWKNNMDEKWNFKVDTSKKLEDQKILAETRAIIANIFYDYWATDYQKQRIDEKDKKNAEIQEIQKRENYNPDNIFKNKKVTEFYDISEENNGLTVFKEEKWYKTLFKSIKNFFKKNKNRIIVNNKNSSIKTNNLQQLIDDNYGEDPFWRNSINNYFKQVNKSEMEKVDFLSNLVKDKYLINEFTKEIITSANADDIFEKYRNKNNSHINNLYKNNEISKKIELAKKLFKKSNITIQEFQISRIEELQSDLLLPKGNHRGLGGIIISDDNSYLVCGSAYPISHYIEEFKRGKRSNFHSDDRTASEIGNMYLSSILEIAGGIKNIPNEEMSKIYNFLDIISVEYKKISESENNNLAKEELWFCLKKEYNEFFQFERYIQYNEKTTIAKEGCKNAYIRFRIIKNIEIVYGDITEMTVDVIVNSANKTLLGGGGVDGAVHKKAGIELYNACKELGGCNTGNAKITDGYKLNAKKIIHTVPPIWGMQTKEESEKLLKQCYQNSYELAQNNNLKTIAFPCLGMGVYQIPLEIGGIIAIEMAIQNSANFEKIYLVCFGENEYKYYSMFLEDMLDNYQRII